MHNIWCLIKAHVSYFLRTRLLILQSVLFFVKLCQYIIYNLYISRFFLPLAPPKTAYQRNSFMQFIVRQFSKCSHLFFSPQFKLDCCAFLRSNHPFSVSSCIFVYDIALQHQKDRGYPNPHSDILLSSFPRHTSTTYFVDSFNLSSYPRWVFFLTSFPSI